MSEKAAIQAIFSAEAPAPAGHYSQAVRANGLLFVSGMLPSLSGVNAETDTFEDQVRSALAHCRHILAEARCTLEDVVQCTAYIVGVDHWTRFNQVYGEEFGAHKPARAVVPVPQLRHGALIELQIVARCPA